MRRLVRFGGRGKIKEGRRTMLMEKEGEGARKGEEVEGEREGGDKEAVAEKEEGESKNQVADVGGSSQPEKPLSSSTSASNNSRYLENDDSEEKKKNKKKDHPPTSKRMTRAERARLEALASFGGTDLASVSVKKRDLREELQRDVQLMAQGDTRQNRVKPRTRVQNSSEGVKDVLFGERGVTRKRKLEVSSGVVGTQPHGPKTARRMTKAERARLDTLQSFGGCGFDDVLATSRKKIAKTFEMKEEGEKGKEAEGKEEDKGEEMEEQEEEEGGEKVGEVKLVKGEDQEKENSVVS